MSDRFQAGYNQAKAQAMAIARMYEREIRRMAVDTWMTSPARRLDFTPEGLTKERELETEGWRKGDMATTAGNIASAIEGMKS